MLTAAQRQIKSATARAVERAGGSVAVIRATTMSKAALSRYMSESMPDIIPLDHALELDAAAGDVIMAREFAALCEHELVSREQRAEMSENITRLAARFAKEGGEMQHALLESQIGPTSPAKERAIDNELADVRDVLIDITEARAKRTAS